MSFSLRPYQAECIRDMRDALRRVQSILLRLPTGGGKTAIAAYMAGSAARRSNRVVFGVHRRELIRQTAETFDKVGIPYGIIAAGMTGDARQPVQIASIPTLKGRLDWYPAPTLYVPDEAHHCSAATWSAVLNHYRDHGTRIVGLSATPERLDGTGLGGWFDEMVHGPETAWLIENGYLAPYRLFAPASPDLSGIKKTAGDFNRHALEERMSGTKIIGDAVSHYRQYAEGRRAMAFCVSIKHSLSVVEQFCAAGYRAAHIDGSSNNRDALIEAFRKGEIQILSSVDLVSEGFDLPALECAILLRPTCSLGLYLQQVGRALRIFPGKQEAIILDHAGNSLPINAGGRGHGLPDDIREWTLQGRKKKKREAKEDDGDTVQTRQCPVCFRVHSPAPHCPNCGHEYKSEGRKVENIDGKLQEVQRKSQIRERTIEQAGARTHEELVRIGKARGMKNPHAWATHVMRGREQKKQQRTAR